MKQHLSIIVSILLFAGCGTNHYEKLQSIDTLSVSHPDSAYTLLKSVDPNQLRGAKEHAYYALLFTQAQYKNYDTIKNDSLIDIAVDYYTDHPDGDKLTRAFMYKGAVLNEMGLPRAAIDWYKKAEEVCDTSDYLTLGLLNSRMGELYQTTFIANNEDIEKYKKALSFYRKINHKQFENYTLSSIGQIYRLRNNDSAYSYINQAILLDKERADSSHLFHDLSLLAELYSIDNKYNEAKNTALFVIKNQGANKCKAKSVYSAISNTYVKLGMVDSAMYYAKQYPLSSELSDTMSYYMILEKIAVAQNDYKNAYKYDNLSTAIADSIISQSRKQDIYSAEKQFDNHVALAKATQYKSQVTIRNYLIIIAILIIIIVIAVAWLLWSRKKRLDEEKNIFIEQLQSELRLQSVNIQTTLNQNIETISTLNESLERRYEIEHILKDIVEKRMRFTRKLMELKYSYGESPERFMIKFNDILAINKKSKDECDDIIKIANQLYNNIIDYITEHNENINYGDQLLLSLVCLQFTNTEIMMFLNRPTMQAVYKMRSRLGEKLKTSFLDTYIESMKTKCS